MRLAAGARLGPYEILAHIGAGGMGEVYRARDPRLTREVAIKVLPASLSQEPERLSREKPPRGRTERDRHSDRGVAAAVEVYRVDLRTGRRDLWKVFGPTDTAGDLTMRAFMAAPDANAYAYTFSRGQSDLYVVEG